MINYLEYLRARNITRWFLFVVAGFFVLALILRPWSHNDDAKRYQVPAGAKDVRIVNSPDGSTTTDFTAPNGDRVHIWNNHRGRFDMLVHKKHSRTHGHTDVRVMGIHISEAGDTVHSSSDFALPIAIYFAIAAFFASILAVILGLCISANNEHLEIVWTQPVSRDAHILGTLIIDVAAIFIAWLAWLVMSLLVTAVYGQAALIHADSGTWLWLAFCLLMPLAFYGLVIGFTSSRRLSAGGTIILIVMIPLIFVVPAFSNVHWYNLGTIARIVDLINPFSYFVALSGGRSWSLLQSDTGYTVALFCIFIAGVAAALLQWRRLEG